MRVIPMMAAALVLGSTTTALQAQDQDSVVVKVDSTVKIIRPKQGAIKLNEMMRRGDSTWRNRATLGMHLSATGTKRDTLGLFVASVVPGGPAENAGIVEGDRIVSINNTDLRTNAEAINQSRYSNASLKRVRTVMAGVTVGSKVTVRYYSNGQLKTAIVTAKKNVDVMPKMHRLQLGSGEMPDQGEMNEELQKALRGALEATQGIIGNIDTGDGQVIIQMSPPEIEGD